MLTASNRQPVPTAERSVIVKTGVQSPGPLKGFDAGKEATGWAPILSRRCSQPGLCWR